MAVLAAAWLHLDKLVVNNPLPTHMCGVLLIALQATIRCFPFDQPPGPHTCLMTGKPAAEVALFAKSY